MENKFTNLTNTIKELKETINSAVAEIKDTVKENLMLLSSVKKNLSTAYQDINELTTLADDLSISMESVAETTFSASEELENILSVIYPEEYGEDYEEYEEDDDEDCIIVEDIETGEETEYPIN